MAYLRLIAQRYKLVWLLYLTLTFIGVQGVNIHLDVYDHQHHAEEAITSVHDHHSSTHICGTTCNVNHGHESITELDITPEGIVKNLSSSSLILALLTSVIFVYLAPRCCVRISWRRNPNTLPLWQFALRPPLRAPPV